VKIACKPFDLQSDDPIQRTGFRVKKPYSENTRGLSGCARLNKPLLLNQITGTPMFFRTLELLHSQDADSTNEFLKEEHQELCRFGGN
jgi:hypothetical protein